MKRSLRIRASVRVALLFGTLAGCEETNNKGWLVDRTRILGARIEAKVDPSRASITPGEPMRATWLVGAPNGTGHLHWAFAVCAPIAGNLPEARCDGAALASGKGQSDGELVVMDLDAPQAVADARELQLLAAFCENGESELDASRFEATCGGGGTARLASATIRIATAGPNKNPEVASDAVLFDGIPLPSESARPGGSCVAEARAPIVGAGTKHKIGLRFRGDEREADEEILASHIVTAGELERQYSLLAPTDPVPKEASVEWTAPKEVAAEGRLVEVYVVLRDGRGGQAFARRTVCVGK